MYSMNNQAVGKPGGQAYCVTSAGHDGANLSNGDIGCMAIILLTNGKAGSRSKNDSRNMASEGVAANNNHVAKANVTATRRPVCESA